MTITNLFQIIETHYKTFYEQTTMSQISIERYQPYISRHLIAQKPGVLHWNLIPCELIHPYNGQDWLNTPVHVQIKYTKLCMAY